MILLLLGLTALAPAQAAPDGSAAAPRQISLDSGWRFLRIDTPTDEQGAAEQARPDFQDTSWETVTLPHTAHVEPLVADKMWQGTCWYRRHLTLRPEWRGRKVFADFGAAMSVATVWVNGRQAVTHYGGYLPFSVDLTSDLHSGDNVIAVRLDNRDNPEVPPGRPYKDLDFTWYSGLYRGVSLRVTAPLHITDAVQAGLPGSGGVFVTYPEATSGHATVEVRLHVLNEDTRVMPCRAQFVLADARGRTVATAASAPAALAPGSGHVFTGRLLVTRPNLWFPDRPYLYQLRCAARVGGMVTDTQQSRIGIRRVSFSASGGFRINGRRMYLRGCNRAQEYAYLGYALSDNAQYRDARKIKQGGFDFVRLSHYPQSPAFLDACDRLGLLVMEPVPGWQFFGDTLFQQRSVQDCRDMIRRDRNHPCIVLWETSLNETRMDKPFMDRMQTAAHEEYPGDQCYTAGWMDDFDVFLQSRQAGGCHGYKNGDKASIVDEYGDWEYYAGNAGLNQKSMLNLKNQRRNSRQTRADGEPGLLQQGLNFQQAANDNRSTPAVGDNVWCMYDYSRGYATDLATCGTMDSLRLPKFSYFFFQSQRDADSPAIDGLQTGPMAHIASWWNDASLSDVTVYSNCAEVALFLNGAVVARQKPDTDDNSTRLPHPPFTFHLGRFTPGTLKAVGLIGGAPQATDIVKTPGKPVAIRLRFDESGRPFTADGADAVFVYADVVDAAGTVVPTAGVPITVTITGPAKIVDSTPTTPTGGTAGFLIQAGGRVGRAVVQATGAELRPGKLTLTLIKPRGQP